MEGAPPSADAGMLEGVIVQALSGWFVVETPRGSLLCRPRGRFKRRAEVWRDVRDAERVDAALDPEAGDEEAGGGDDGGSPRAGPDRAARGGRAHRSAAAGAGRARGARTDGAAAPGGEAPASVAEGGSQDGVLAGDRVLCRDVGDGEGAIEAVLPRRGALSRPPVANADHVVVVVGWREPPFSAAFIDRLLVEITAQDCAATVCLNKADLLDPAERRSAADALEPYARAGFGKIVVSAATAEGLGDLDARLAGHLSVVAGPSGAGKSRLIAALCPDRPPRSAELSRHAPRGRHTTRHVELLRLPSGGWIADTPGFSRLTLEAVAPEELPELYPEFTSLREACKFRACLHDREPECAVRRAVHEGAVDAGRYARYLELLAETRRMAARRY